MSDSSSDESVNEWLPRRELVNTILGEKIHIDKLGKVLSYEHLSCDLRDLYLEPPEEDQEDGYSDNRSYIRYYPYSTLNNLLLTGDEETSKYIIDDLKQFKVYGGGTVVETSCYGYNRNVKELVRYSKETGIHIVLGTGYNTARMPNKETTVKTREEMYQTMLEELEFGYKDNKEIRAGVIGEISCNWPLQDLDKKMLKATGNLVSYTKYPVLLNLPMGDQFGDGYRNNAPYEILRQYQEAGGPDYRLMLCNARNTFKDERSLTHFLSLNRCFCGFDMHSCNYDNIRHRKVNLEKQLNFSECFRKLVEERLETQIILSNNIHTRHELMGYGGCGLSHIEQNVLPYLANMEYMDGRKIQEEYNVQETTTVNPKTWLDRS